MVWAFFYYFTEEIVKQDETKHNKIVKNTRIGITHLELCKKLIKDQNRIQITIHDASQF